MSACFIAEYFAYHKAGNAPDEYEDALKYPSRVCQATRITAYAIADGAAVSAFSRIWAEHLVYDFVARPYGPRQLSHRVDELMSSWLEGVEQMLKQHFPNGKRPWWIPEHVRRGAFATFLGLSLHPRNRRWECVAVGDSCLFQVSGEELIARFPLRSSAEFGNTPRLIPSQKPPPGFNLNGKAAGGGWQSGDRFYLATDALAGWFLREYERNSNPWSVLDSLMAGDAEENSQFRAWIDRQREEGAIRNDDVTLLRVNVVDDSKRFPAGGGVSAGSSES